MHDKDCEFYKRLAEVLVIGAARVADDGTFLWVNQSLEEILEYSSAELIGTKWQDYTHPHDVKADAQMVDKLLSTDRKNYGMTKRYLTKTGRVVWTSLHVSEITEGDKFLYFVSQIVPIETADKQSQSAKMTPTVDESLSKTLLPKLLTSGWGIVTLVGGSLVVIIAEVIKRLYEKGVY